MLLQYWIDKYSRLDQSFRGVISASAIDEAKKYQKNIDFYYNTEDPVLFLSVVYYKNSSLATDALVSTIMQLKMTGIIDDIKLCILALSKKDILPGTLKEHRAVIENCRVSCTGKNQTLAKLLSNLLTLRINKTSNLAGLQAVIKMLIIFIDKKDAKLQILRSFRKFIDVEVFESILAE